ncbi:MAG: hypothetical protein WCQ50_20360 [Spirochaetota bacterium]
MISSDFATAMDRAGLTDGDRAANRASEDGSGGADVAARQTGGYNFYYHFKGLGEFLSVHGLDSIADIVGAARTDRSATKPSGLARPT